MALSREEFEERVDTAVPYLTITGAVSAVLITALSGKPDHLPGIALGSPALLYLERWAVAMAVTVIGTMLLVRGLKRETPSEASASGVSYGKGMEEAVAGSDAALSELKLRADKMQDVLRGHDEGIALLRRVAKDLGQALADLRRRVDNAEGHE